MKISKLTFVLLMVLVAITAKAQRADRFTGTKPSGAPEVITGRNFEDKTRDVRLAIESFGNEGGNIELRGNITLQKVRLKSNIHINIRKGTYIKLARGGTNMFSLAKRVEDNKIRNVRFYCSDCGNNPDDNDNPDKRYTIDISDRVPTENANVWLVGNVENFSISHFIVKDNYTRINAVSYVPVIKDNTGEGIEYKRDLEILGAPRQGDLKYGHVINAHSGYGLVQTQAGKNLNFHHLSSEGGVTVRLESGAFIVNIPTDEQPIGDLDDIDGYDVRCKNGYASVSLSPHCRSQGTVVLENIKAESCNANVLVATGFQDRSLLDIEDFPNAKFKKGTFKEVILKGNIFHSYGDRAQTEEKYFDYYPSCIRQNKTFKQRFAKKSQKAPFQAASLDEARVNVPSMANVLYKARKSERATIDKADGEYLVRYGNANFRTDGFDRSVGNITYSSDRKNIICSSSAARAHEPLSEVALNTLSTENENNLYIDAASKTLHAKVASKVTLHVFDVLGSLVKTSQLNAGKQTLNISELYAGIYFAKFKLNGKAYTTKFYIK